MKKLVTGMLVTSVALAMFVGTEGAYALGSKAPHVTYGQQDRGTAVDTQATGEEGIRVLRVKVQPGDVLTGGRVIGADPDRFIRNQLLRDYDLGSPDSSCWNSAQTRPPAPGWRLAALPPSGICPKVA